MRNLAKHLGDPRRTSQREPIPGHEHEMVQNVAGGYVFQADDWERLDRFLIIGSEGGSYYVGERELTIENAAVVRRCFAHDFDRTLSRVVEVSKQGLAPKNDPAILAMALAFTVPPPISRALRAIALREVCRTGTHLFQFLTMVRGMRGGGRSLNGAVRAWIEERPVDDLALQMVKYRSRDGWTWRDVMRRFRPPPPELKDDVPATAPRNELGVSEDYQRSSLYAWASGRLEKLRAITPQTPSSIAERTALLMNLPRIVQGFIFASGATAKQLPDVIRKERLPWECVPSEHTTDKEVLCALLESMPMMATVRQLSKLQAHGVLPEKRDIVLARLRDEKAVKRSRIHPVALLLAAHAYEKGEGRNLMWDPDHRIVDALDDAMELAFKHSPPTGKRILVAIDSSGSMGAGDLASGIPLFKVAAAMALTYVRSDGADVIAFDAAGSHQGRIHSMYGTMHDPSLGGSTGVKPLPLSSRMRMTDAMRAIAELPLGGATDCSLPFRYALERGLKVDAFVCFTDGETWAGNQHPAQALAEYRQKINPKARAIWCAMTVGSSSLELPGDMLSLGIAGFDASAPQVIGAFIAGAGAASNQARK